MGDPKFKKGETYPVDLDWQDDAACNGADVNLFFNHGGVKQGKDYEKYLPGLTLYCLPSSANNQQGCPVIDKCRELAIKTKEPYGIWGGMTTTQRRKMIKERQRIQLILVGNNAE